MTDKERMEKIGKNATGILNMDSGEIDAVDIPLLDFTWLFKYAKEQAERVQELEKEIKGRKKFELGTASNLKILREQNKRYRETIQNAYFQLDNGGKGYECWKAHQILGEAMEDEKI